MKRAGVFFVLIMWYNAPMKKNIIVLFCCFVLPVFIMSCATSSLRDDSSLRKENLEKQISKINKHNQDSKFYFDTMKDYVGDDILIEFSSIDGVVNNNSFFKVTINNYLKDDIVINYSKSFIALLDDSGNSPVPETVLSIFPVENINDDNRIINPDMALELSPYPLEKGQSKVFYICIEINNVPYFWKTICSLK